MSAFGGERIGTLVAAKYRLDRVIGQGGMGAVYSATHIGVGRTFAVKLLHIEGSDSEASKERFLREARVASTVGHPGIVDVFDVGETEDGAPYMVMELLEGETLADRIRRGRLSVEDATSIACEILEALSAAHAKGIVHRDIKPQNVFLKAVQGESPRVRVLDFGIAKVSGADGAVLTATGAAVGTALYMSPEQATAERDLDARADVWAVGVVLFEMLAGEAPFLAPTLSAVIAKIVTEDPPSLAEKNPLVSPPLAAVVARALARRRADRISSASAFLEALEPFAKPRSNQPARDPSSTLDSGDKRSTPPIARTSSSVDARAGASGARVVVMLLGALFAFLGIVFTLPFVFKSRRPESLTNVSEKASAGAAVTAPESSLNATPAASTAISPSASTAPSAVASTSGAPRASASPSLPKVRVPSCSVSEVVSEGHCCPKGLIWSKLLGRCDRPLATSIP